jgi:hypothetical protein
MKAIFVLFLAGAISVLMSSCTPKTKNGLPPSTGGIADVLVVMPDSKWETTLGTAVKLILMAEQEGLNQAEAMFDLHQITAADFKGLFEKNRKIIRITVSDTVSKEQLVARNNVYSDPQIIIDLSAKTDTAAIRMLKEKALSVIEMLKNVERNRIAKAYESTENLKVTSAMKKQFGFHVVLPESFYQAKTENEFAWYRMEPAKYSQAVFVYTRDFVDSTQLQPSKIIDYRNYICKQFIPGELPGSYMSTDTIMRPVSYIVPFAGNKATEVRGLWRTEGDFMGGPFLSYTFHDIATNKVVTLEGYIYYPSNDKRDLMMQVEAILHSYKKVK